MATRVLDNTPSTLPLYLRAALPALPVLGSLPGIKHTGKELPDLTLSRLGVRTDADDLAAYSGVCGFGLSNALPPTYPHMAAFGLQLSLMTDTAFPFAPMGMVHVVNTITQHRPIGTGEEYDVSVTAANLRPHRSGRCVDLLSTASVGGDVVWEETSTYLVRGKRDEGAVSDSPLAGAACPTGPIRWRLPGDLGRSYGAVSGDRNPIHLYGLTAKAFGFPRQIAHGMWTKARCLAALEGRLPEAYRVDVEFRKPVLLPSTVVFGTHLDEPIAFGVSKASSGDAHLVGRVTAL